MTTVSVSKIVHQAETFVFDCDGVLWNGNYLIEGTEDALQRLRAENKRLLFITNNSAKSRAGVVDKFKSLGVEGISTDDVITSGYSAARFLETRGVRTAIVLGSAQGIGSELNMLGIEAIFPDAAGSSGDGSCTVEEYSQLVREPHIGAVVAGSDTGLTFAKLARASLALENNDCLFVATNRDATINVGPPGSSRMMPEAGSTVGALEGGTGRKAIDVGKGGEWMMDLLHKEFGIATLAVAQHMAPSRTGQSGESLTKADMMEELKRRTVMIGDRLDTDVAFGKQCGFTTVLPLTGVTSSQHVQKGGTGGWKPTTVGGKTVRIANKELQEEYMPDVVVGSLAAFVSATAPARPTCATPSGEWGGGT